MNATAKVIRFPVERTQPEELLTLQDLRDTFGFSERWWRYRLAEGMPAHRWCGQWRFRASEIEQWMERRHAG